MLPTPLTSQPNRSMREGTVLEEDYVLPVKVLAALWRMNTEKIAGQVILNFNQGSIQSFEVKEHTRL